MEEMQDLFYKNPYLKHCEAVVVSCEEDTAAKKGPRYKVVLDDTIFYPEGGGQPCDLGTFTTEDGVFKVLDTRKDKQGFIYHVTEVPFEKGQKVTLDIDWARRFDHMQNHSGEHVFSGLLHARFGCENVGFHMGEEIITLDFDKAFTLEEALEVEKEANDLIWQDHEIRIEFPSAEELKEIPYRSKKELSGAVRIVTMPGADICACCGTHVKSTAEIGMIKVLSLINYKGGVRIEIVSGDRALRVFGQQNTRERELMRLLAAEPDTILSKVTAIKDESAEKDKAIAEWGRKYFEVKEQLLPTGGKLLIVFEEGMQPIEVRRFCEFLLTKEKAEVVAVLSDNGSTFNYVIGSRTKDVRADGKAANAALNGRGGGSPAMVQGSFAAAKEAIESKLNELFG